MSHAAATLNENISKSLIKSVRHIMKPLIRLMMKNGIVLQTFNQLVKSVYTEEAEKQLILDGGPVTDLQISLMTGLHRKEVKRFREEGYETFMLSPTLSNGADVVTRWLTDRRFQNGRREPKSLSIRRGETVDSFTALVRTVDAELRPSAVLSDLVRMGVVQVEDDRASLAVDAFVPQKGFEDQVQYLAENGHDHLAAAVRNLMKPGNTLLDQSVTATELSAESVDELERTARSLWKLVMQQIMERAMELEARDKAAGRIDSRMNFGVYFYSEPLPMQEAADPSPRRTRKR